MAPEKILFVINTLGRGGAETALIELMKALPGAAPCEIDLYVMLGQGELISRIPEQVRLLNRRFDSRSVLSPGGRSALRFHVLGKLASGLSGLRNLPYMAANYRELRRTGTVNPKNLLWKAVSDGTRRQKETYDLAIAYLEGAATYYVADRVTARKKAAFLHTDYRKAGYSRALDRGCYGRFDAVFCVSAAARSSFLSEYPEYAGKTQILRNIIDPLSIRRRAEIGGFTDGYDGLRIISLGRLVKVKSYETAIRAARILVQRGHALRWYVFGEGEERTALEQEIRSAGLEGCFVLAGAVDNPFPYLRQSQIYVQCSSYEGQSMAVREAKVLGLPVVLTRTDGNAEQITDQEDGLFVDPGPENLAEGIERLIADPGLRERLGAAAKASPQEHGDLERLLALLKE